MIPFLDLQAQYAAIQDELEEAVVRTLRSTRYILGDEVEAFEEEFADYCDARHGIAVNSGTSALHAALLAAGVGPGDEVITVASTFVATVAAIKYVGARPVYVDVDSRTLNMDPALVEDEITDRTKAILPVHLHGNPADLSPIGRIADDHGLTLIEDAAQAHGAEYAGRRVGAIGDIGCFSFYPGKNLGACGEAGMVVTNSSRYAESMRKMRDWGQTRKYQHDTEGFNYRMDAIQAAALRVKLRHLAEWTDARRRHAETYNELLSGSGVGTPIELESSRHVYHVYAIRINERDRLREALGARQVQTGIHYPIPVHLQPAYAEEGASPGDLPVTEQAAAELLSLPMYAELTEEHITEVSDAIRLHMSARD